MRIVLLALRTLFPGAFYNSVVGRSMKAVRRRHAAAPVRIVSDLYYGATQVGPQHLAIWYLVGTNADLDNARTSGFESTLAAETREQMRRRGYPDAALEHIHVGVESVENIEKAGGAYLYFK